MSNPDVPLGTAEQFLLTMSSINELAPRLHLWAFKLDYDQLERVRNLYDRNEGDFFHLTQCLVIIRVRLKYGV